MSITSRIWTIQSRFFESSCQSRGASAKSIRSGDNSILSRQYFNISNVKDSRSFRQKTSARKDPSTLPPENRWHSAEKACCVSTPEASEETKKQAGQRK